MTLSILTVLLAMALVWAISSLIRDRREFGRTFRIFKADVENDLEDLFGLQKTIDDLKRSTGGLWPTGRGDLMQIRDMTDLHLENAIQHCVEDNLSSFKLRHEQERRAYGKKLETELLRTPRRALKTLTFSQVKVGECFKLAGIRFKRIDVTNGHNAESASGNRAYFTPGQRIGEIYRETFPTPGTFEALSVGQSFEIKHGRRWIKINPRPDGYNARRHDFPAGMALFPNDLKVFDVEPDRRQDQRREGIGRRKVRQLVKLERRKTQDDRRFVGRRNVTKGDRRKTL